ncbi:hypothetical protein Efla_000587 [Eimeria flavescens]
MPTAVRGPGWSVGLSGSSSLTSSSYSSSISSESSISSAYKPKSAAPAQAAQGPQTAKPFIPPKIVTGKKMAKRPLPKRAPLTGVPLPAKAGTGGAAQRQEQLAALQTQLMMSRATIGQRWKEAWSSVDSSKSAVSGDSIFESFEDLYSSKTSSERASSAEETTSFRGLYDASKAKRLPPSSLSAGESDSSRDIMALLEGEISSATDVAAGESLGSLNLTSSGFVDELSSEPSPPMADFQASPQALESIMPRPLQSMKLRLFQGSGQESSSSISSPESSRPSAPWRHMPSRETSVPEEHDSSEESESEAEVGTFEREGDQDHGGSEEALEDEDAAPADMQEQEGDEERPQLEWVIDQPDEEEKQPQRKAAPTTRVIRRPLQAADLSVEDRIEEDACLQDFDRREMTDRVIYEYAADPLTPKLDKLRAERIRLAEWAKNLSTKGRTVEDRPVGYRPPLVRRHVSDVGSTFPRSEVMRPLTAELSSRGEGIEARMANKALLPSTRVWQIQQLNDRLQSHTEKQREHLRVLQSALRKQAAPSHSADGSHVAHSPSAPAEASPRSVELKLYEEQCAYLAAQLNEEHEFCDVYRQQLKRALFKNMALKKRQENALEAIKQHKAMQEQQRAKHLEAEEQLDDLKEQVERESNKRVIETSVRQQREEQSLSLQERYAQLVHYLQEAEEKRSAYEDGLREAQSHAQKATALLQTKEMEIAYAKRYMETHHSQMLEKEILMRKERDRANLAERQVNQLNGSLAEKDEQISNLLEKITDGEALWKAEQQKHEETRGILEQVQTALRQKEAQLEAVEKQMNEQRSAVAATQAKLAALEVLAAEYEASAGEAKAEEADIEAWRNQLEARRSKALALLKAAENSASSVMSQLEEKGGSAEAVNAIAQQVDALRVAREEEVTAHEQEFKKATEERQKIEAQLEQKEEDLKRLEREKEALKAQLQRASVQIKNARRRVVMSAPAYGKRGHHSFSRELRTMRIGSVMEMSKPGSRRPELRYLKMFKHGIVMWTEDLTGKKGFKKGDHFAARDIIGIDFGPSSSAYLSAKSGTKDKNLSSEQTPLPWRCFTVRTITSTCEFRARSDEVAQDWIIGLGRLSKLPFAPTITSRRELIVHRVCMKLKAYAEQRGVPLVVVWKEAINRTLAQMPHIRQRAADKASQDSKKRKDKESRARRQGSAGSSSLEAESRGEGHQSSRRGRLAPKSPDPAAKSTRKGRRGSASPEADQQRQAAAADAADGEPGGPTEKNVQAAADAPSPSNRHRRRSANGEPERRRRHRRSDEGRHSSNSGSPTARSEDRSPRGPLEAEADEELRAQPADSSGGSKPPRSPSKAEAAQQRARKIKKKKSSKGILSRAGSIFRRNPTGRATKENAE